MIYNDNIRHNVHFMIMSALKRYRTKEDIKKDDFISIDIPHEEAIDMLTQFLEEYYTKKLA